MYATPTVPLGREVVVMAIVGATTLMLSDCCADNGVGAESVTCTVKFAVPEVVGCPEITPVLALSVKPAGKLPEATLHARLPVPPLAARVWL